MLCDICIEGTPGSETTLDVDEKGAIFWDTGGVPM